LSGPGPAPDPSDPRRTPPPFRADRGRGRGWRNPGFDHGEQVDRRDQFARQVRSRARLARRNEYRQHGRPISWRRRQGFGCLFGFFFLILVASIIATMASVISNLGPLQVAIGGIAIVAILGAILRGLVGAARDLDRTLAATRRVEDGDYGVRVGATRSDLRPIQELARGFDTMVARLAADEEQRRTLLADVSHELRTPLTVITGNLEAILDGVYPADAAHLTPILDETRVMERLIEDLRTVALSEAGTLPLHPEPTDPDVLLGEVARSFRQTAEAAGVTITTDTPDDLPILDVDPVRIREVLSNLVGNALRHTPSGGSVTLRGVVAEKSVVLTVSDTGPGIDRELLPHVFDRFVKGEASRGSGLGLAIARGLVEAHGGTISVLSPAGGGTTFRVALPIPKAG
jgi:signal transduction histidine kinase